MTTAMHLKFQHPCTALIVGGTGAGKTYFVKKLVENGKQMFNTSFENIVFYYSEWQPLYETLSTEQGVDFRQEFPLMEDHPTGQSPKLIVIDDFMDEIKNHNKELLKFFIKVSHHRNLSIFFLSQCLCPEGLRQISLNSHLIVLFKSTRDLAQIRTFCLQVDPTHWRALLEAYQDATQARYTYILFDFKPKQLDHMRIRTHIFPDESCVIYIPKAKYKREMQDPL